ncbi:hypothetical protein DFJ73DRAFT_797221, partial [Zopfochytrium polystomum]
MMATSADAAYAAPSIPPAVQGPVQFYLRVSVPKILWTNPPSPDRRALSQQPFQSSIRPRVELSWWGSADPPSSFHPSSVGDRRTVLSEGARVADRHTLRFPVRCNKQKLHSYLTDMGLLVLQIFAYGRSSPVGIAKVPDLAVVAALPYSRPINGWFSVLRPPDGDANIGAVQNAKLRDLGELNVSVVLEPVPTVRINEAEMQDTRFDEPTHDDTGEAGAIRSEQSEESPLDAYMTEDGEVYVVEDDDAASLTEVKVPNAVSTGRPADSLSSPDAPYNGPIGSLDNEAEARQSMPTGADRMFNDIFNRALRLRSEIDNALSNNPSARGPVPHTSQETAANTTSQWHNPVFVPDSSKIDSELDGLEDYVLAVHEDELSETYSDILLDDDLVIEALNSCPALMQEVDAPSGTANRRIDFRIEDDDFLSITNSDDCNAAGPQALKSSQTNRDDGPPLDAEVLTALGRVHSIRVTAVKLELKTFTMNRSTSTIFIHFESDEFRLPDHCNLASDFTAKSTVRLSHNAGARAPPQLSNMIVIDQSAIFPARFDGKDVSDWLKAKIDFSVIGSAAAAEAKLVYAAKAKTVQPVFSAFGSWRCKEVIATPDFNWSGRVPLFAVAPAPKNPRNESARAHRHVGDLLLTVELISVQPPPFKTSLKAAAPPDEDTQQSGSSEVKVENDPPTLSRPPSIGKQPFYLFVSITTVRGLSVYSGTPKPCTTLLNLVVRLFASISHPTSTPPIPYLPPVDLVTGRLNKPLNFDFALTVPLALTSSLLQSIEDASIVAEVWASDISSSVMPSANDSSDLGERTGQSLTEAASRQSTVGVTSRQPFLTFAEHVEDGKRLVGLLKLPSGHLLKILVATCLGEDGSVGPANIEAPILMPETEYPVIDPFTGSSKGWITGFMAIGSWEQILSIRRPEKANASFSSSAPISRVGDKKARARSNERQKAEKALEKGAANSVARVPPRPLSSVSRPDEENEEEMVEPEPSAAIEVTIHSACGLRGLVEALRPISSVKGKQRLSDADETYTSLDYAREVGTNSSVVVVFPESFNEPMLSSRSSLISAKELRSSFSPRRIQTPIVARSFIPSYRHSSTVAFEAVDATFLRWVRGANTISAFIWHHVPRSEGGGDILLGRLTVPVKSLLERPEGLNNEWIPVRPVESISSHSPGSDSEAQVDGPCRAAVKLSMKISRGFEFGTSLDAVPFLQPDRLVRFSLRVFRALLSVRNLLEIWPADREAVVFKWNRPFQVYVARDVALTGDGTRPRPLATAAIPIPQSFPSHAASDLFSVEPNAEWVEVVEPSNDLLLHLRSNPIVIEVLSVGSDYPISEGVSLGRVYIDAWDAAATIRRNFRRKAGMEPFRVEAGLPLISETNPDLGGATVDVSLSVEVVEVSHSEKVDRGPAEPRIETAKKPIWPTAAKPPKAEIAVSSPPLPTPAIKIKLIFEKGVNLLEDSQSLAAFPWNDKQFGKTGRPPHTFVRAHPSTNRLFQIAAENPCTIVPFNCAPTWNYSITIHAPTSKEVAKKLLEEGAVEVQLLYVDSLGADGQPIGSTRLIGSAMIPLKSVLDRNNSSGQWFPVKDAQSGRVEGAKILARAFVSEGADYIVQETADASVEPTTNVPVDAKDTLGSSDAGAKTQAPSSSIDVDLTLTVGTSVDAGDLPTADAKDFLNNRQSSHLRSQVLEPRPHVDALEGAVPLDPVSGFSASLQKTLDELEDLQTLLKQKRQGSRAPILPLPPPKESSTRAAQSSQSLDQQDQGSLLIELTPEEAVQPAAPVGSEDLHGRQPNNQLLGRPSADQHLLDTPPDPLIASKYAALSDIGDFSPSPIAAVALSTPSPLPNANETQFSSQPALLASLKIAEDPIPQGLCEELATVKEMGHEHEAAERFWSAAESAEDLICADRVQVPLFEAESSTNASTSNVLPTAATSPESLQKETQPLPSSTAQRADLPSQPKSSIASPMVDALSFKDNAWTKWVSDQEAQSTPLLTTVSSGEESSRINTEHRTTSGPTASAQNLQMSALAGSNLRSSIAITTGSGNGGRRDANDETSGNRPAYSSAFIGSRRFREVADSQFDEDDDAEDSLDEFLARAQRTAAAARAATADDASEARVGSPFAYFEEEDDTDSDFSLVMPPRRRTELFEVTSGGLARTKESHISGPGMFGASADLRRRLGASPQTPTPSANVEGMASGLEPQELRSSSSHRVDPCFMDGVVKRNRAAAGGQSTLTGARAFHFAGRAGDDEDEDDVGGPVDRRYFDGTLGRRAVGIVDRGSSVDTRRRSHGLVCSTLASPSPSFRPVTTCDGLGHAGPRFGSKLHGGTRSGRKDGARDGDGNGDDNDDGDSELQGILARARRIVAEGSARPVSAAAAAAAAASRPLGPSEWGPADAADVPRRSTATSGRPALAVDTVGREALTLADAAALSRQRWMKPPLSVR